jgi:hydrogenase-4 transcriptional activator
MEIGESLDRIGPLVAKALPAHLLGVWQFDLDRQQIEPAALGECRTGASTVALGGRALANGTDFQRVLDWASSRQTRRASRDRDDVVALLAIAPTGDSIVGPLFSDEGPIGALVAWAAEAGSFTGAHESLVRTLLEPLAVALANDRRLHELRRLREALEADKRALLSRLGRQEVTDAIVGADAGFRPVMERVEQVARTDAPVLILGETGTGKEVVARAIHAHSRRAAGPIMRVNCGALPSGLVDSELFGHERGSFTGAIDTRRGWFERADGGTIFLDEIGELPPEAQVRLLRVLQDGTFERVGGHKPLHADVRVIAATHRDLHDMVGRGAFREDLWYRIGVFPIRLPPLRERLEDIPALAAFFAGRTGVRLGGRPLVPTPADIAFLLAYDWPGNVRELAAVIERAAILGDGRTLRIASALGVARPRPKDAAHAAQPTSASSTERGGTLDEAVIDRIEQTLVQCHGRIEGPFGAAARLGVNPHTLRARMRKLGIDWARFRHASSPR